jgi:hypothetical protein
MNPGKLLSGVEDASKEGMSDVSDALVSRVA